MTKTIGLLSSQASLLTPVLIETSAED